MDILNQLFALARDVWERVFQPLGIVLWGIAASGPVGILIALIFIAIGVYAYQEARR